MNRWFSYCDHELLHIAVHFVPEIVSTLDLGSLVVHNTAPPPARISEQNNLLTTKKNSRAGVLFCTCMAHEDSLPTGAVSVVAILFRHSSHTIALNGFVDLAKYENARATFSLWHFHFAGKPCGFQNSLESKNILKVVFWYSTILLVL
jgi:hypothetical protein